MSGLKLATFGGTIMGSAIVASPVWPSFWWMIPSFFGGLMLGRGAVEHMMDR